jgi:putative hydrolase of the HAD superfamily
MRNAFSHVRTWVFDLDNTLYRPEARLFDQIQVKMTNYVVKTLGVSPAKADHLRQHYWQTYGTTLAGLMAEHRIDPLPYLADVHDIDFSGLTPDPALARAITALPGRRIVFTNASRAYAHDVLAARGLSGIFDAIYGVEHAGFIPKPQQAAFEAVFALDGHDPREGAMFEDETRNLAAPFAMGMRTVLVGPVAPDHDHIHYHTNDLAGFLSQLV